MENLERENGVKAKTIREKHLPKFTGQYKDVDAQSNPLDIFDTSWRDKLVGFSDAEINYVRGLIIASGTSSISKMRQFAANPSPELDYEDKQILKQIFTGTGF
jgi:hypothetical protein